MMLSDGGIWRAYARSCELGAGMFYPPKLIEPFEYDQLQPCSYDLRLGEDLLLLTPGLLTLSFTLERVAIPNDMAARIEGKSSTGRRGVVTHLTAGFVDAGFVGHLTLELVSFAAEPVQLLRGERIAQLALFMLDAPAQRPYGHAALGSHYQNQPARGVPAWGLDT